VAGIQESCSARRREPFVEVRGVERTPHIIQIFRLLPSPLLILLGMRGRSGDVERLGARPVCAIDDSLNSAGGQRAADSADGKLEGCDAGDMIEDDDAG
jgi:hypothetical protein